MELDGPVRHLSEHGVGVPRQAPGERRHPDEAGGIAGDVDRVERGRRRYDALLVRSCVPRCKHVFGDTPFGARGQLKTSATTCTHRGDHATIAASNTGLYALGTRRGARAAEWGALLRR